MSILKLFAITNVLCVLMIGAPQIDSFEKQALSLVRAMPASDLDAKLPGRPFASWLDQILSAKAGVVWQLTECGKQIPRPDGTARALPACVEITALLPDKRRVFITVSVGTFKEGLIGKPAFFSAVIEQKEKFYLVRQLYNLPEILRATDSVSDSLLNKRPATKTKNRIVTLPAIKGEQVKLAMPSDYLSSPSSNFPGAPGLPGLEEAPPAPFPQELEEVSESALQGRAINRVNPVYSAYARKLNATGTVEVEVTISEAGLVIDARAVSGHLALRSAAVEAARKWIFKPAIFKDVPVKMKGVLTFTFGPGAK